MLAHVRRGGHVLGLCGGYQMLGQTISDPQGIEGVPGAHSGLGLLDVVTEMSPRKTLTSTQATYLKTGDPVEGYEIHIGSTDGPDCSRAWLNVEGRPVGASSADGRIKGCYLHGLFTSDRFRAAYIAELGGTGATTSYDATVEATLDQLAAHLETHLDMDTLLSLAQPV